MKMLCPECSGQTQALGADAFFCLDCDWDTLEPLPKDTPAKSPFDEVPAEMAFVGHLRSEARVRRRETLRAAQRQRQRLAAAQAEEFQVLRAYAKGTLSSDEVTSALKAVYERVPALYCGLTIVRRRMPYAWRATRRLRQRQRDGSETASDLVVILFDSGAVIERSRHYTAQEERESF